MLTYLVEDSMPKVELIVEFMRRNFPEVVVKPFGSYQSGLRAIEDKAPELVLLDMTLPNFDRRPNEREGRLRALGGYELMRKLKLRKLQSKVIIVSQLEEFGTGHETVRFSEIVERCSREFPDLLVGSVYFGQGSTSNWREELGALLASLSKRVA
jgi:CheY-like chemotaxis protein